MYSLEQPKLFNLPNQNPIKPTHLNNPMITTLFQILAIILTTSIYIKTRKISTLSSHQGINLINSAFLFFSLAYITTFLIQTASLNIARQSILQALTSPIQTYLFTIAALYLAASLFWKNQKKETSPLHIIALLVTVLSNFTSILTLTLTTIYAITTIQAYTNYQKKKTPFSQIYLIAIALLLISQILTLINFAPITPQSMTITAFSIFLYGTLKIIK